ncbi:hypothetical protein STCU_08672 [Strigomonas culicis]|uniref:Uncharacterized protein n=1 Tax=Strigomonas culicis TaxID=28005 RepID=S9TS17_9TRYP|nr:hypothetical protein STCU_08672 [Strigomonas culicis]|eukprot:EPY21157.1 hypothetical protein STCU_08672 [Strigomonas culicis]
MQVGHNTSVLIAYGARPGDQRLALDLFARLAIDPLRQLEAANTAQDGYFDTELYCAGFKSATEARDFVENTADLKVPEIGSHPLFSQCFLNLKSLSIKGVAQGEEQVRAVVQRATSAEALAEFPVVCVEAVTKQVHPSPKGGANDVLLASIRIFLSHVSQGPDAFCQCIHNDRIVPSQLTKGTFAGAGHTMAIFCLSPSADAASAGAAAASLEALRAFVIAPPRSGNVERFLNFAKAERERISDKGSESAFVAKLELMLSDSQALLANPQGCTPRPYSVGPGEEGGGSAQAAAAAPPLKRSTSTGSNSSGHMKENPIHVALVVSPLPDPHVGSTVTFNLGPDGKTISAVDGPQCTVDEIVVRAVDDWRTCTLSEEVGHIQSMFENGNNTAVIGTVSWNEMQTLDKQPLWLSYKRMVSSLISVASQKYAFAEVSLSVTLVKGNELLADLLTGLDSEKHVAHAPKKLSVAFSPLFGPTVYKTTMIKPPTPLQLESTINSALYQVPTYLQQCPNEHPIIFASAILKGVRDNDVYTSSLVAASTTDPQVFQDILDKKPNAPHELFEYTLGGPCCTLFFGDVNQGDTNVAAVINLIQRLRSSPNRSVRSCSVKKFISFAEETLKKTDEKLAAAQSDKEKESILKGRKSMEVFYNEYKALYADPQNRDPKTYRKSGGSKE